MRWPSLQSLWNDLKQVCGRFPLQVLVILLALVCSFLLIEGQKSQVVQEYLTRLLLVYNLMFVLLLSADLFSEVKALKGMIKWLLRGLCLLAGVGLYFTLRPTIGSTDFYRFMLLAFSFHLLVAFAPFINRGNINGFWEYNKILFIRILTAALYAGVLYIGLAIAVSAVKGLFNVQIDSNIYLYLLAVVGIGFSSMFFLAGVPREFNKLNEGVHPYPKGLKIFSQYVLIPLLTIYLSILLVYEAKIMIDWAFPKGMVSLLILGYSVFGMLSLLLIHPVKDEEGNGWMKLFARFFYFMMIPLVVLLLLAVWERLRNYGITESRYILLVLAVWLTIITTYFLISKKDNIKIIPMSLCILALLAAYGPQSAFSVSAYSQQQRLERLMGQNNAYALNEKPAIVHYLVTRHGLTALQDFTTVDLHSVAVNIKEKGAKTKLSQYQVNERLVDTAFALLKVEELKTFSVPQSFFYMYPEKSVSVQSYDEMLAVDNRLLNLEAIVNGHQWAIIKEGNQLHIKADGQEIVIKTDPLIAKVHHAFLQGTLKGPSTSDLGYAVPEGDLSLIAELPGYQLKLVITELTIENADKVPLTQYDFKGYLLIKIK